MESTPSSSGSPLWWLPPFAIGCAVYAWTLHAGAISPASADSASGNALSPRATPLIKDAAAAFAEVEEAYSTAHEASGENLAAPTTTEAIQRRLLELEALMAPLRAHIKNPGGASTSEDYNKLLRFRSDAEILAVSLGELDHETALKWVQDHDDDPSLHGLVIQGWANSDPKGAWQYLLTATAPNPCPPYTVMKLIKAEGEAGPEAMKAAAEALPWHLMDPGYGTVYQPLSLDSGTDYHPWVDSGAARSMVEQGVKLQDLFPAWFREEPQEALAAWASWPGDNNPGQTDAFLIEILQTTWQGPFGSGSDTVAARVDPAVEALFPADAPTGANDRP